MKKNIPYLLVVVLFTAIVIYSCSKSSDSSSTVTTPPVTTKPIPVATATVKIQGFAFSPDTVYLKPGGTVTWTNNDTAPHTATDLGGAFNSSSLSQTQTYSFTFPATPGTYNYKCTIHSSMKTAYVIVGN